jgi:hypothetical protein
MVTRGRRCLPVFGVKRSGVIRVHLGFRAKSVEVSVDRRAVKAKLDTTSKIVSWTVTRGGIISVFAHSAGDASYVARLRLR